ncbi:glutamate--tRNA ligase 1 [Striga asiatica]|uniref:Glutamate--tRNA ligase 1 n=1 Tax=Striga asiatica TaxID=4170 RepID=A0A5A7NZ19_STRAF|nr:glutamate--tRNA ligase 1 [Striga asiatica]
MNLSLPKLFVSISGLNRRVKKIFSLDSWFDLADSSRLTETKSSLKPTKHASMNKPLFSEMKNGNKLMEQYPPISLWLKAYPESLLLSKPKTELLIPSLACQLTIWSPSQNKLAHLGLFRNPALMKKTKGSCCLLVLHSSANSRSSPE